MQLSNTIPIFVSLSLITVAFYFFVKNAHWTIRVFAQEVMEKVADFGLYSFCDPCSKVNELDEEKMKTEEALHDFLPVSVVRSMKVLNRSHIKPGPT